MFTKIKKNMYLLITTITFSLSVVFALVVFISLEVEGEIDRTSVGFVYLGDKSESQYATTLTTELFSWKRTASYTVYFQEYVLGIDLTYFDFDSAETITRLKKNSNNKAYFEITDENEVLLENEFRTYFSDDIIDEMDMNLFIDTILSDMESLYLKKDYQLENFLNETLKSYVIDQTLMNSINLLETNHISSTLSEIIIPKNQRFSLLASLAHLDFSNEELSIIASGMQSVLDKTSMSGFSYEQNREMPLWGAYGQNVRILQVNHYDFSFFNHFNYDLKVTIEKTGDNQLQFSLIGYPYITNYQTYSAQEMVIPYQTIYYPNELIIDDPEVEIIDTLTETTYRLKIQDGIDGEVVFYYRDVTPLNEETYTIRLFSEQYLPQDEIYYEYIIYKEEA